jgi:hypothetical protein
VFKSSFFSVSRCVTAALPLVRGENQANFLAKIMNAVANQKLIARRIAVAHHRKTRQRLNMV